MNTLLLVALLFAQRPAPVAIQTGTITGVLLQGDGAPAAKVRVSAMSIPGNRTGSEAPALVTQTETDAGGRYRLTEVPVGRYYVVAGFVDSPTYYPRGTGPAGATPISVGANSTVANIDFRIERISTGLNVSGRLIVESSSSNTNLRVVLSGSEPGGSYTNLNAPLKLDGSFEFLRVRPGTYTLSVSAPFFQPITIGVVDKDVTGLELRVPWTREITGRVVLAGEGPLPAINLLFSGAGRQTSAYAQPANLTFRAVLSEGFFALTAPSLPSGFYLKSATAGSTDLMSAPLQISRADSTPEIVVTVGVSSPPPWVKLTGRMTGSLPAPTSRLSLSGPSGSLESAISSDGSFEFPRIIPGIYTAFLPQRAAGSSQQTTLIVPNRDLAGVELKLPVSKEIAGRVLIEDGGPPPRLMFTMTAPDNLQAAVSANATPTLAQLLVTNATARSGATSFQVPIQQDGTFKANWPEGTYPIALSIPTQGGPPPYIVKSFTYGSADLLKDALHVAPDGADFMKLVLAPASPNSWAKISGRVLGLSTAEALSDSTTVMLSSQVFNLYLTAEIKRDGSFVFPKVYRGTYQVQLNGTVQNIGMAPVEVNVAGSDVTNVEISVPRRKEVSGRIILEGRGVTPRLSLPLTTISNAVGASQAPTSYIQIQPQRDGAFKVVLPEGERQLGQPSGIPAGYALKSAHYGSTDLASSPLRVTAANEELLLRITTPDLPAVRVRGKIVGLSAAELSAGRARVNLRDPALTEDLQARVMPDGAFEFPSVFPGNYTAELSGVVLRITVPTLNVPVKKEDVTGLELVVPRQKEILGRVVLEGRGSMPWFGFSLYPLVSPPNSDGRLIVNVNVNPSSDGTFRLTLPEGERRAGGLSGLAPGYFVKAITYGNVDLLTTPMKVRTEDTSELVVTVATPNHSPVRVAGRITGVDMRTLSRGGVRVRMNSQGYAEQSTFVSADGAFEFPAVFPGSYSANVFGDDLLADHVISFRPYSFQVTDQDIRNLEIALPAQKEVLGRVIVEGRAPVPRFVFHAAQSTEFSPLTPPATQAINVQPDSDGRFRLILLEGERPFGRLNLPTGFTLKAVTYGGLDVLSNPLKVTKADTAELVLTLTGPSLNPVSVSGKVEGLESGLLAAGQALVTMTSLNFGGVYRAAIRADGSFEFRGLFPGNYFAQVFDTVEVFPAVGKPTEISRAVTNLVAGDAAIEVMDKEITDLTLSVKRQRVVSGRVIVQGGGPLPRLPVKLHKVWQTSPSMAWFAYTTISIIPDANGRFSLTLSENEQSITVYRLPAGYDLKSMANGVVDFQKGPLHIPTETPTGELRIILQKTAAMPWASVSGKVTGLAPEARNVRVILEGMFNPPSEIPVSADGRFAFADVFQGPSSVRLAGDIGDTLPSAVPFVVGSNGVADLEVVVRR
jgi:hypothetical protein